MPQNNPQVQWDDAPQVQWDQPNDPYANLPELQKNTEQQANTERVGAMGSEMARENPNAIMGTERFRQLSQPHAPEDQVFKTGTTPQKIHRAVENVSANLLPAAGPLAVGSPAVFLGSAAGGSAGGFAGKLAGEASGLSPDWSDVAGDAGAFIGSSIGGYGAANASPATRNSIAQTFREPYTGNLKKWVPRVPFFKFATEALVPRGEEGTITNPVMVPRGEEGSVQPGQYFRVSPVRLKGPELPEAEGTKAIDIPGFGPIGRRLSPLIYENEAQANQIDALNSRLRNEASKAGMYSAARGAVRKPLDYQQRIGRRALPPQK